MIQEIVFPSINPKFRSEFERQAQEIGFDLSQVVMRDNAVLPPHSAMAKIDGRWGLLVLEDLLEKST